MARQVGSLSFSHFANRTCSPARQAGRGQRSCGHARSLSLSKPLVPGRVRYGARGQKLPERLSGSKERFEVAHAGRMVQSRCIRRSYRSCYAHRIVGQIASHCWGKWLPKKHFPGVCGPAWARCIGQIKEGEEVVGQRVRAKVVKNKVAPPFRTAEFDMMADYGISYEGNVLDMAAEAKLVTRTGAWFRYGDMQLGQGREKTRDYLKEHPELVEELREKLAAIHAAASGKTAPAVAAIAAEDEGEELPPDE